MRMRLAALQAVFVSVLFLTACGGGGGGSSNSTAPPPPPPPPPPPGSMSITTPAVLPSTVTGHAYSATLTETGGSGTLHWTIAPLAPFSLFVPGLSMDATTGQLSGSPTFTGTGGFTATVTDSSSPPLTATKGFTMSVGSILTAGQDQNISEALFSQAFSPTLGVVGGAIPLTFSATNLPPGMHLNGSSGAFTGGPSVNGTFRTTITTQDSLSPPETVSQTITFTILPAAVIVGGLVPATIPINVPFDTQFVANGGTPPYTFSALAGPLPTGLTLDASTGRLSGIPTVAGSTMVFIRATDSATTPQTGTTVVQMEVGQAKGRNDTPATATRIGSGGVFGASISPYIDPPNGAPFAPDHDYYRFVTTPGAVVHVETSAKRMNSNNPLDTVIEILDVNGVRLNTCRQPGDSGAFNSPCLNDDISASPHIQDSALDFQVPPTPPSPPTYLIHVFDWAGNARPDMVYNLQVNNVVDPLSVNSSGLPTATNGQNYFVQLSSNGGSGNVTWTLASGSLPPGLNLSAAGVISGTPTSAGTYPFAVQATDQVGQIANGSFQIHVN